MTSWAILFTPRWLDAAMAHLSANRPCPAGHSRNYVPPAGDGAPQQALESAAERRGLILPGQFDVPDHELWITGYRAGARRSLLTIARTLDETTGIVRPFADPLLERTAAGQWEPATGRWSG